MSKDKVVLSSEISAGSADAADELELLKKVFFDTGFVNKLKSISNPKCIIVGPTGVGKTALINHLDDQLSNSLQIHPDDLSISYIHRSNIIKDMESCGVNLAPIFKFMWQHVFLVELIRLKFDLNSKRSVENWLQKLKAQYLSNSPEFRAVNYMEKWGHNIWESVTLRVREMTQGIESAVKADASIGFEATSASTQLSEAEKLQRKESYEDVVQSYISEEIIKEQKVILDICVNDFFQNKGKPYYILIDDLDKDWAPNDLKGLLLKSLILAVKHLKKVPNVKIILGLREDIKHQLFNETPTPGFQEDKFESLELKLSWNHTALKKMADLRINASFKSQYTNSNVKAHQIFQDFQIEKSQPLDYIINRTRLRPRELILFLNTCIEMAQANNANQISRDTLIKSYKKYSTKRVQAVHDEWSQTYPCVKIYMNLLKRKPSPYSVGRFLSIDTTEFENELAQDDNLLKDPIGKLFYLNKDGSAKPSSRKVLRELVKIYYQCGIVGIKCTPEMPILWTHSDDPMLDDTMFDNKSKIIIHPAFYGVLATDLRNRE